MNQTLTQYFSGHPDEFIMSWGSLTLICAICGAFGMLCGAIAGYYRGRRR